MTEKPESPYQPPMPEAAKQKLGWKWIEVAVIVAIVAVLVALLLPAVRQTTGDHSRSICNNNLKQIGLALHNYHGVYGSFPPAVVCDESGQPAHSWRILILPFLDEQTLYDHYRFDEPWDGPNNRQLQDKNPECYACPKYLLGMDSKSGEYKQLQRMTNYAAITGRNTAFRGSATRTIDDFKDGTSNTLMVTEVAQRVVHWMSPDDISPAELLAELRRSVREVHSNHAKGIHVLFVDGGVRYVSHDIKEQDLNALLTIDGSDETSEDF